MNQLQWAKFDGDNANATSTGTEPLQLTDKPLSSQWGYVRQSATNLIAQQANPHSPNIEHVTPFCWRGKWEDTTGKHEIVVRLY